MTDPAGIVTSYTYDGQNRLETVTTPEGVTTYAYWPDDLLKTVTYPSGVVSSYGYDRADRLASLESRQAATVVSSYAYTYDANGNRLSQTETNGGPAEVTTYTYDARDRLETVTYGPDDTYSSGRVVTYTYDDVGNRLKELTTDPVSGNPLASKSGTFDALNRLTVLEDLLDPPATITFDYDPNGNQTAKTVGTPGGPGVTTAFRYDVRDKLVEVETPTVIAARMEYDAAGRLSKKIGEDGIRQYVYDEDSRFLEYDTAGLQVAKYSYGADRLISLVRADEGTRFYHLDGLGSVTTLTDPAGAVTSRLHLDAWGVFRNPDEMNGPGASKNRFAFTGYVFDRETELYFAKARFYDPTVGRFTSQDSFLGEIDRPPSLHRYFYANANPVRYIDPTGHCTADVTYANFQDCFTAGLTGVFAPPTNFLLNWGSGLAYRATGNEKFRARAEAFTNSAEKVAKSLQSPAHLLTATVEGSVAQLNGFSQAINEGRGGEAAEILGGGLAQAPLLAETGGVMRVTPNAALATAEGRVLQAGGTVAMRGGVPGSAGMLMASNAKAGEAGTIQENTPSKENPSSVRQEPVSTEAARGVRTPHGLAVQAETAAALAALNEVQSGATVYRQGSFGVQNTADAQFWSLQNPAGVQDFANELGMPGGATKPDRIMGGTVAPGSPVVTRPAPGIGTNVGGGMEAVVPPNGVENLWFYMPDWEPR